MKSSNNNTKKDTNDDTKKKEDNNISNVKYTDSELFLLNSSTKDSPANKSSDLDGSQNLTVKEMIDNLKRIIDTNSVTKLFIGSSRDLLTENGSGNSLNSLQSLKDRQLSNKECIARLSKLCKSSVINNNSKENVSSIENEENASTPRISSHMKFGKHKYNSSGKSFSESNSNEDMYPLTDSFLSKVININKNKDQEISDIVENYDFSLPKGLSLENAIRILINENLNIRLYSKDIELELKDLIKVNEMLENENDRLEKFKRRESMKDNNIKIESIEESSGNNLLIRRFKDVQVNTLDIILKFIVKLNEINDEIISEDGMESYYKVFEDMINSILKNVVIQDTLLQNSIEENIKKNIEFEFFKYKNNYTFSIHKCISEINELKHNISSLKKEKEVLLNENRQLKAVNMSLDSDICSSRQSDQSFTSISSDYQDIKSMYEIGSESTIKSSKFSKLTNSAKKIIKNKKSRTRGFSVTLPVKVEDSNSKIENKRRNSIIESSTSIINNNVIPHVFIPHSYIKPTKCEICQELCWRKEVRCKTCGYRCHERCQGQAEKVTSCIVNKVQKANMISELESQKKLFGTRISTFGINEIDYIPYIVKACVNEVEKRGLEVEGIYRKSGNVIKTRNLVNAFDRGETPDISELGEYPEITVITSTLKQYFRDLPEALIPKRLFYRIKEIIDIDDEVEQVAQIKTLIEKELSKYSYETLKFLSLHLYNINAKADVNLMTSKNLGVVFGPTLIGDPGKTDDNQNSNMISTVCRVRAIDLIIRYAKEIFNYISDKERNHISMDMLRDLEQCINDVSQSNNNLYKSANIDSNTITKPEKKTKHEKNVKSKIEKNTKSKTEKNASEPTSIAQL